MSYKDRFNRYGRDSEYWDSQYHLFFIKPDNIRTAADIARYDSSAAQTIRAMQAIIEDLTEYRQALAARYAQLETMLYTDVLKLTRRPPNYENKIYYDLTITRRFEDGTEQEQLREKFPGKERREAFKRFEELKKKYPGIKTEQDTDRKSWEK